MSRWFYPLTFAWVSFGVFLPQGSSLRARLVTLVWLWLVIGIIIIDRRQRPR